MLDRGDPDHLRYHRLHPACRKAVSQGLGRGVNFRLQRTMGSATEGRDRLLRGSRMTGITPRAAVGMALTKRVKSLRVFGRLAYSGARGCTEAGVGKASKEETAGSFAPAVVAAIRRWGFNGRR